MTLGKHILIEFYDCDVRLINDAKYLEEELILAAKAAKAEIINSNFHEFSPQGVTGVLLIMESHISIHTWPEHAYAAVDFFSCNEKMDLKVVHDLLKKKLKSERSEYKIVERGTLAKAVLEK
jgi:S-adenosylmethionine decarboxylase